MIRLLIIGLVLGLVGCDPAKKIQKAKQLLEDSGELAGFCADAYPVKETVRDSVHFDTLYYGEVFIDTVTKNDTVRITKTVPQIVTKTVTKEIVRENTAKVHFLETQLKQRDDKVAICGELLQSAQIELNRIEKRDRGKVRIPIWWLIAIGAFAFRTQLFKLVKTVI